MANTTWALDPTHSELQFKVKHLMISTVTGQFNKFSGTVETEENDFTTAKVHFETEVNSISTNNEQRDLHLKAGDFFDAEKYPKLTFVSSSLTPVSGNDYKLKGDFTLRGVTKPIELVAEFGGVQKDLYGQTVAGFEINGKIKRSEFGLTWSAVTEAGGLVVGEDVKLHINAELIKKD